LEVTSIRCIREPSLDESSSLKYAVCRQLCMNMVFHLFHP